ncbi:MAG: hypothetical protein JWM98_1396, partial [Thermoleophilia bacterium]|nr:hypothetical protein [Thermoleophilia bacterium]
MIGRFKAAAGGADSASMTADSAPNPRFRTARVHVPETHEERIVAVLDDTEGFLAEFNAALTELGEEGAWDRVVELARIGASSTDPHHAHAARRMSATMLVRHAFERSDEDVAERFAPLDRAAAVLVPALEEHPHEPELLDLLGMVALGLGDIASARHLFQTVLDIDPSHDAAADHLRACGTRGKHGWSGVAATAERLAPTYSRARSRVKGIAEAARHLP